MARKKKGKVKEISTGFTAHRYQTEYFNSWRRFNLCVCCRGWGKTVMAVNALIGTALKKYDEPRSFGYIAPKKGQAKDITWPIFKTYLRSLVDAGEVTMKNQDLEIHFHRSGNVIKLYGTDDGNDETIRGKTLAGVVVDEFDGVKFSSWLEIIRPTLRTHKGWALIIGTIKPGGNMMMLREKHKDDHEWNIKVYKFSECWEELPAYDENEYYSIINQYRDRPNEFAREYECDDTAATEEAIIPMNLIVEAKGKHIPESNYSNLVKVMGVDVATGVGRDKSSICKRQGLACHDIQEYNLDNMAFADVVAMEIERWEPDAVFVDKGRGEGVISRLRQLGYNVVGVDFGGRAMRSDIYQNKRTEMYHAGIKGWLETGGVLPEDDTLCQELATPMLIPVASEKFLMERKDKIKERIGRSPDKADSLALTFAAPVVKRDDVRRAHKKVRTVASTGYNPLSTRNNGYGIF